MSLIEEIRAARVSQLTEEHKEKLLAYIKKYLTQYDYALIGGAAHFSYDWKNSRPRWQGLVERVLCSIQTPSSHYGLADQSWLYVQTLL